MPDTLLRQWSMLRRVPRHPQTVTVNALLEHLEGEGFDINKRSIQRDLGELSLTFPLLSEEGSGRVLHWSWQPDAPQLDIPGLSPAAALAFRLAELYLPRLMAPDAYKALAPYFEAARAVLGHTDSSLGGWPERVRLLPQGQPLLPPETDEAVFATISRALLEGRRFEAVYRPRSGEGEPRSYPINPLGLVVRDQVSYLVATVRDYSDIRLMALHRFEAATLRDEPAVAPAGFDLDRYIHEEHAFQWPEQARSLPLVLRANGEIAHHLDECPLAEDQRQTADPDGGYRIEATVADTAQLRWWLRGFGAGVEVVAPEGLREEMKAEVRRTVAQYGEGLGC